MATIKRIKKDFALEVPISNITPKYIQNYITSNDEWTYSQKYRIKSLLNVFFDYAVSLEIIENNPARKIVLNKPRKTAEELEAVENKYLEPDELNRLLKEFYRKPITYRYGLLSEFMTLNGCRIGEAAALKLKNYHKGNKTIDIHGTLTKYDDNPTTPKTTASYRTVYLTDREVEILDEIISMNKLQEETNPKWEKSDFIFVTNTGNSVQSSVFAKSLQRANERLQRPINKHISSHIFRHTMISMLAEYNIPLKAIMDRVGHSDSETTTKIYTHVTKNMKNKAVEVLNHIANSRKS